jgi:hypothetical protein
VIAISDKAKVQIVSNPDHFAANASFKSRAAAALVSVGKLSLGRARDLAGIGATAT